MTLFHASLHAPLQVSKTLLPVTLLMALAGCHTMAPSAPAFTQETLPEAVKVPAGHAVALETVGAGEITYECRAKADNAALADWVFVGPKAELRDRRGRQIGTYFGPPATWAAQDGSSITGTQVATAPAGAGNIPFQLVKANASANPGMLAGTAYIQRVALKGGAAPASACSTATVGTRETVTYQADYIFWKAS